LCFGSHLHISVISKEIYLFWVHFNPIPKFGYLIPKILHSDSGIFSLLWVKQEIFSYLAPNFIDLVDRTTLLLEFYVNISFSIKCCFWSQLFNFCKGVYVPFEWWVVRETATCLLFSLLLSDFTSIYNCFYAFKQSHSRNLS